MLQVKSLAILPQSDMPVCDAAGEPQFDGDKPCSITFNGPGTKKYQAAKHRAEERNNTRAFARMQNKVEGKLTAEEKARERAEFLADCTESFNNFGNGDLHGRELYLSVYADIEIGHIADDADKYLAQRANFLPKPAKS